MILSGAATQSFSARLAAETGQTLGRVRYEEFPDGEQLVRVPESIEGRAIVVASTVSDAAHVQLLQLQDAAHEAGADEVVTVIPYLGYARQDVAETPGEPVSIRAVARAVSTGTDRVITVSPHEPSVVDFFAVQATAVEGAARLADTLPPLDDPVFLAPDQGAVRLARTVRDAYGHGVVDHFEKHRRNGSTVEIRPQETDVGGRPVVAVDDIVATGGTMSQAITHLEDPTAVHVACVHPVLVEDAYTRLINAGVDSIHGTDTVERPVSEVSVAPSVADVL